MTRDGLSGRPDAAQTIVVLSLPKSGSTALFYRIKKGLPRGTRALFEPELYEWHEEDPRRGVLAKVLFRGSRVSIVDFRSRLLIHHDKDYVHYHSFSAFTRKVLLVRDPRDRLISHLLYSARDSSFADDPRKTDELISLLRHKEEDPQAISVLDLISCHHELSGLEPDLSRWRSRLQRYHGDSIDFHDKNPEFFAVRYEDVLGIRLPALDRHLGFRVPLQPRIRGQHRVVARTKGSRAWKDWFLTEDVAFLRPALSPFMERYGYHDDWTLNPVQRIRPRESSRYIQRLVSPGGSSSPKVRARRPGERRSVAGAPGPKDEAVTPQGEQSNEPRPVYRRCWFCRREPHGSDADSRAIVIPTHVTGLPFLNNLLSSIDGYSRYPILIVVNEYAEDQDDAISEVLAPFARLPIRVITIKTNSFEFGGLYAAMIRSDFESMFLLPHSCEVVDTAVFDLVFEDHADRSVCCVRDPAYGHWLSYLGKYRRRILTTIPLSRYLPFDILDATLSEMHFTKRYDREDPGIVELFPELATSCSIEERFGMPKLKIANDYIIHWNAYWEPCMVLDSLATTGLLGRVKAVVFRRGRGRRFPPSALRLSAAMHRFRQWRLGEGASPIEFHHWSTPSRITLGIR